MPNDDISVRIAEAAKILDVEIANGKNKPVPVKIDSLPITEVKTTAPLLVQNVEEAPPEGLPPELRTDLIGLRTGKKGGIDRYRVLETHADWALLQPVDKAGNDDLTSKKHGWYHLPSMGAGPWLPLAGLAESDEEEESVEE